MNSSYYANLLIVLPVILLIAGLLIALLARLTRRSPRLIEPRCAGCDYDLRAASFMNGAPEKCPECGADLSARGAVIFGKYIGRRRRWPIFVAVAVVLLPVVLLSARLLLSPRGGMGGGGPVPGPNLPTAQILARLPNTGSQPWDWQELERRSKAGSLSAKEVDTALGVLVAQLKKTPNQPMHWTRQFLEHAVNTGKCTPIRMQELAEAYYAQGVAVTANSSIRAGKPLNLHIRQANPWEFVNTQHVYHLRQVLVDDKPADLLWNGKVPHPDELSGSRHDSTASASLNGLAVGKHQLKFIFDQGLLQENQVFRGKAGKPGAKDKWPQPICTWENSVSLQVNVAPSDQQLVELVSGAAQAPFATGLSPVKELMIRLGQNGPEVVIVWAADSVRTPVVGRLKLTLDGKTYEMGPVDFRADQALSHSSRKEFKAAFPDNAGASTADLIIEPAADLAERYEIYRIWGKTLEFKDVPISRFDLEKK